MTNTGAALEFPLLFPHPSRAGRSLTRLLGRRGARVQVVTDGVMAAAQAPDAPLIHLTGCRSGPEAAIAAACAAVGRAFVLSPFGELSEPLPLPLRLVFRRAAAIHVSSPDEAAAVRAHLGEHPHIDLIPNDLGAATEPADAEQADLAEAAGRGPYLLAPGAVTEPGLAALVDALPLLPAYLRLVVAGGAAPARLEQVIREQGLAPRVDVVEPAAGSRRAALYRAADLTVLPAPTADLDACVLESLAHGTPVLTTSAAPWRDLAEEGCGYWVDPEPQAIAAAIKRHHKLKIDDRRALAGRGRAFADVRSGASAIADALFELYRRARVTG